MEKLAEVCRNFMLEGSLLMRAEVCQLLLFILALTSQTASAEKNIINTRQTFINSCDKMVQQHLPRKTVIGGNGVFCDLYVVTVLTDDLSVKIRRDEHTHTLLHTHA